jgi:SpoVK/Ycf46/Vps4 family AAA+-type ATPase
VSIKEYRKVFLDYQQGHIVPLGLFSHPNDQKREAVLSDEDKVSLQDAVSKAAKGELVTVLLYGHSDSNKALILNQLAHLSDSLVYVLDLAQLSTDHIGETEKNLARIIAEVQSSEAILFFDEADALFVRPSALQDASDSYANQQVSYLLKLCSQHPKLYVLATDHPAIYDLLQKRVSYVIRAKSD